MLVLPLEKTSTTSVIKKKKRDNEEAVGNDALMCWQESAGSDAGLDTEVLGGHRLHHQTAWM